MFRAAFPTCRRLRRTPPERQRVFPKDHALAARSKDRTPGTEKSRLASLAG